MKQNYRQLTKALLLAAALGLSGGGNALAQSVVFPQEQQAGTAQSSEADGVYTLSNDLLSASFTLTDGVLTFGGCEAMNLNAGTELFKVVLGDGTEVLASQMTLVDVALEDLMPDASAAKASLKMNGKAIVAHYTYGNLALTWRAVLRDGSHYLRTELDLTATADQAMTSITPMMYNVNVAAAGSAPKVVGNTRGAIIASDKIFAGLETPMGINSVVSDEDAFASFTPKAWTASSFSWTPGEETPSGITALGFTTDQIVGAKGYVTFTETGDNTITFEYASGTHRLNIVGVDITDGLGNVIDSDYHVGYTGSAKSNNVYTLTIPERNSYILRYFVETKTETVTSSGNISFNKRIKTPVVVYDLVAGTDSSNESATRRLTPKALSTSTLSYGDNATDAWTTSDWGSVSSLPADLLAIDSTYTTTNVHAATRNIALSKDSSTLEVTFTWSSGSHALVLAGVDVLKSDGSVVASDYHVGYAGQGAWNHDYTYTLTVPEAGSYSLRYLCRNNVDSSGASTDNTSSGSIAIACSHVTSLADGLTVEDGSEISTTWTPDYWTQAEESEVPLRVGELGYEASTIMKHETAITFIDAKGSLATTFTYTSGNNRLQIVGVDLLQGEDVAVSDYHFGYTGNSASDNTFTLTPPNAGTYTLRFLVSMKDESNTSSGNIDITYNIVDTLHLAAPTETPIVGRWSRNTTLSAGTTWNVSTVVGLVAPGQQRRSVLCYSERERAVPWRPFPLYNSWYELNINRNNATAPTYSGNFTIEQCVDVMQQWQTNLYDKYGKAPMAFVWDDGWDEYGTWKFNCNFPNGFAETDSLAKLMNTGIGAWLGPVGGYGTSGTYRRSYWSSKGGMQLSNKDYYDFFVDACRYMVNSYEFRFFKYDGISAQFSATGPDSGTTGEENAEAIIQIERDLRETRPDLFLNTTVGTWASPFWFQFTDAVWRQENDYGTIGVGTDREKWITYRDRLVYQNFVQNSPLCPINTLMTHGLILTGSKSANASSASSNKTYDGIVREMRCAFACGSGMVELYVDYALMNSIKDNSGTAGALWGDLAECMDWQEANADVLPDIHWVGGNPWDGSKANVYGWAAWNSNKAVLTLRNPATSSQTFTTTLRDALDIPAYISTSVTLSKAFTDQANLAGLTEDTAIDIDTELTLTLPASSVYVFNGVDNNPAITAIEVAPTTETTSADAAIYDLSGRRLAAPQKGINIIGHKKVIIK